MSDGECSPQIHLNLNISFKICNVLSLGLRVVATQASAYYLIYKLFYRFFVNRHNDENVFFDLVNSFTKPQNFSLV